MDNRYNESTVSNERVALSNDDLMAVTGGGEESQTLHGQDVLQKLVNSDDWLRLMYALNNLRVSPLRYACELERLGFAW